MNRILLTILFFGSFTSAAEKIGNVTFHTAKEYHVLGGPCACPNDKAENGKCGKRSALCRSNGYNIIDCDTNPVTSIEEYKQIQSNLCRGNDF